MPIDHVGSAVDGSLVTTHRVYVKDADQYLIPTSTNVRGVKRCTPVKDMKRLNDGTLRSTRNTTWISAQTSVQVSISFTMASHSCRLDARMPR